MNRQQQGFTLIEILIAVAIGSLVLTAVYGIFASVSGARDRLELDSERYHQVRVVIDRLGNEIRGGYFNPDSRQTRLVSGQNHDGYPYLELSTALAAPLVKGERGGISLVRYELLEEEGEKQLRRLEWPLLGAASEQPSQLLIPGLKSIQLRFFRQGSWFEEWDSRQRGNLPNLVEVALEIEIDGRLLPFLTTIELPQAGV